MNETRKMKIEIKMEGITSLSTEWGIYIRHLINLTYGVYHKNQLPSRNILRHIVNIREDTQKNKFCYSGRTTTEPLRGSVQKQLTLLADMSAKTLIPPPFALTDIWEFFFIFMYKSIWFWKRDRPEKDDFAIKKISRCEVFNNSRNNANF